MLLISFRLGETIQHHEFGNSSYAFHPYLVLSRSWEDSRHACKENGSDLVSIESRSEWIFVNYTIQTMETIEYFIGLRKDDKSGEWRWVSDNSTVKAPKGTFPWASNEPNGDGNCTVVYKSHLNNFGKYNDLKCTRKRLKTGYICESHAENSGKEGVFVLGTFLYLFFLLVSLLETASLRLFWFCSYCLKQVYHRIAQLITLYLHLVCKVTSMLQM